DQVWQMIQNGAGTQFNRELTDLFLSILPPFPLGTRVAVTEGPWQGYTGVVSKLDRQLLTQPLIRLLNDGSGRRVGAFEIDLTKDDARIVGLGTHRALDKPATTGITAG